MTITIILGCLLCFATSGNPQGVNDYLLLQDIGSYIFKTQTKDFITGQPKTIPGYSTRTAPGFLAGADHFDLDHDDKTYETDYINRIVRLAVEVQVTQHSGADSDKWLLHEVEDAFRKNPEQDNFKGVIREINGNRIFTYRKGTHYSWISNYSVVDIRYTDLQKTKTEPLEIVNAYLSKFPSTIPAMTMDKAHDETWIKDEIDRRLWLCDKWDGQYQLGKVTQADLLKELVDHMNVFLNYRDKYYGISAKDERSTLSNYLQNNNGAGIKAKLNEYKTWWSANKTKPISL